MIAESLVSAHIPTDVKNRAFSALESIGLNESDLIRMTFSRVAESGMLPFDINTPNAATRQAIADLDAGKGQVFETENAVFNHLGL